MMGITELIKNCGASALDWSLRFRCFRDYVNFHFIPKRFRKYDLVRDASTSTLIGVLTEYSYFDIKDTIVLDVGSHSGGFAMIAIEEGAKRVYAVEPLYPDVIRENIGRNKIKNIEVIELGIGRVKGRKVLVFGSRKKKVNIVKFSEVLKNIGEQIDFLKIDCEGCEWFMTPSDLKGIQRIEGEIHNFDGKHDFSIFGKMLSIAGFEYKTEANGAHTLVHAVRKDFVGGI